MFFREMKLGASARGVLKDDRDARPLADNDPGRVNRAGDHDVVAVTPGIQAGQDGQRAQEHADPGDVSEPKHEAADEQRQACCHEGTASGGQYPPDARHRPGPSFVRMSFSAQGPEW